MVRKPPKRKTPNPNWRPTKKTPWLVKKLEEAFKLDSTITEACLFAWITRETYYNWIEHDEDFSDKMDLAKLNPYLKAKKTLINAAWEDYKPAVEFLKRRDKKYRDKQEIDEETTLTIKTINYKDE